MKPNLAILIGVTLLLSACAAQWGSDPVSGSIQRAYWKLSTLGRKPGVKLSGDPESVAKQYQCTERELPLVMVEKNEIIPPRVKAGGEINHRLLYAVCTAEPAGVIRGDLHRRIYFKGNVMDDEVKSGFELQPGRWTLDAFSTVPGDAEPGVYALEVEFVAKRARFREIQSFQVEP